MQCLDTQSVISPHVAMLFHYNNDSCKLLNTDDKNGHKMENSHYVVQENCWKSIEY